MSKKYYYTCPIKALYMMKEFGIEFYTKVFLDVESDFLEKELGFHLEIRTLYNKLCQVNSKIYVAKESEHIFEPKKHDLGINLVFLNSLYFDGLDWFIENIKFKNADIIMRGQKQFFMPEVEND